jgi:hypothetical protein
MRWLHGGDGPVVEPLELPNQTRSLVHREATSRVLIDLVLRALPFAFESGKR